MARKTKVEAHLLVEGENDLHVISALCGKHKVPQTFDIQYPKKGGRKADGTAQLLKLLHSYLSTSDKQAIGIVLDADQKLMSRWREVTRVIEKANLGYKMPVMPDPIGVIIPAPDPYHPRLGIWLMPDNQNTGELEDFVAYLIPNTDQLGAHAENVLNTLEKNKLNLYQHKRSKAFIHTWLAWQKVPGTPMGRAITTKALAANSPIALIFVNWLNRLFNP